MAVIDHPVHKKVKELAGTKYGCHNRDRDFTGYQAPNRAAGSNGYSPVWFLERVRIPHVMSRECRYDMSLTDIKCDGCKHRGSGETYADHVRKQAS